MKKLILLLSFVFVMGLVSVNAQVKKTMVKEPVKTEQTAMNHAKKKVTKPAIKKEVKASKTTKAATTPVKR